MDKGSKSASTKSGERRPEPKATRGSAATPKTPADVPDAREGREYQGAGVLNKQGRFGSSTKPEDLGSPPEATPGGRKR